MYSSSKSDSSIYQYGRIRPGVYKIRNIVSKTYVDIKDHVRELCGRPSGASEYGRDQWDIQPLGSGYTIRKARTSALVQPDQYCIMLSGLGNGSVVSVSDLPVAWKIEAVKDDIYSGFEYVRIFWGSINKAWDLAQWGSINRVWDLAQWGSDRDLTKVRLQENSTPEPCRIWELVRVENVARQPPLFFVPRRDSNVPPYEQSAGGDTCTCTHMTTEPGEGGFGTIVTEVTTVTTRRRYQRDD